MTTIEILCTGKLKERYWNEAAAEYSKRLGRFCRIKITELPEVRLAANAGAAEERAVIEAESENVIKHLPSGSGSYIIALDVRGRELSSEALAEKIGGLATAGVSHIVFIIGGSLGLSQKLLERADMRLSFSPMTFPHQMMRVILLEQIYRAYKINSNETYHK